jgi:hypothetical protein
MRESDYLRITRPMQVHQDSLGRKPIDVVRSVRRRWRAALLVGGLIFAATAVYVARLPNEYRAVAVVGIVARSGVDFPGADYVQLDAARYIAYATAPSRLRAIASQAGLTDAAVPGGREEAVDVRLATNTSNLIVTAHASTPEYAATMANAVADAVVDYSRTDALLQATPVARAAPPMEPSGPLRRLDLVVGLAAAILAGLATAVVLESRNPKVVQWRDLAMIDDLPVLGVVPKTTRQSDGSSTSPALASVARTVSTTLLQEATGARPIVAVTSISPKGSGTFTRALASQIRASGRRPILIETKESSMEDGVWWRRLMRPGHGEDTNHDRRRPSVPRIEAVDASIPVEKHINSAPRASTIDFVVIDSPPPSMAEGRALITQSEHVVVVVRRATPRHDIEEAAQLLTAMHANVVGFVGDGLD